MPFTKTGDNGQSSTAHFSNLPKNHPIFECLGALDELNARIGFCRSLLNKSSKWNEINIILSKIQQELFELGSSIHLEDPQFDIDQSTSKMEKYILETDQLLQPLKNFILPGGSSQSAALHLCRTATREAERRFVHLLTIYDARNIPPFFFSAERYINRLSSLFFTLARQANQIECIEDTLWQPTSNRDPK